MVIGNWQRFAWKKPKKNSAHIVSIRSQGDSALVVSISSQGDSPVFSFDDSDWVIEQVEQRWIQGGLLAVLAFQLWRKFGQGGHRQQVSANKEE